MLANQLLEAHVDFQIRQLRGAEFPALVRSEVAWALDRGQQLTLDDVVSREHVKAVVGKYVAAFRLPGSIPEVAGEIATRLRNHAANEATLGEVIPRRHVEGLVEKIAELRMARERVAAHLIDNTTLHAWLADFLLSVASSAVSTNRARAEKVPGVASMLSLGERVVGGTIGGVVGGAAHEVDQRAHEFAERAAAGLLHRWQDRLADSLTDAQFAAALLELWDGLAERPVHDLLDTVDDADLEDLLAIGYAGWLDIRTGAYLAALIDGGVDYFFDVYGVLTLPDLLEEFGLSQADLVEEALRFAPQAIAALDDAGLLAELLRRRFGDFYRSPEARALLARG